MLRSSTIIILYFVIALGLANPINKAAQNWDPEINPDLFEGDIFGIESKNAVRDPALLWPGGIVYYTIDTGFTAEELATLADAFAQYEANSCIRFIVRNKEKDYVIVQKTGGGCYSSVGMVGGSQTLSLDSNCFRCTETGCLSGTPIHEFLHALGFYHEQSRTDRDDYVTINYENIQPGYESNFDSYSQDVIQHLGAPYDYGSVMHYGAYGFAVDPTIPTIIVPDGVSIGQRVGFSEVDLFKLNALYECPAKKQQI
ncbi:zinc metalloproteinase nas-13-like isoform X1 [Daphnia pulicaria]|uniref:zinc metalloproteinase nas-13-like isoform X1 n=1 Tax=Daphnia pulicaria TaxID=35523 RepID=UPI001EEA9C5B|nr:zinc metalloproteinase nas-13-like isoform X1 [Daphnia pulicaria]